MSSSLSPIMIGASGEEIGKGILGQGSVSGVWRSVASCGIGGTEPRLCTVPPLLAKAPRLLTDSEVEDAWPTLSVSSFRDCATDGAAEVFERDHGRTRAAPWLEGPVLGDSVNSDGCALLAPDAVFDDIASLVRLD